MVGNSFVLAPSVQELAKKGITKVPEQYLQLNQDPVLVSNTPQLPIIDLHKLLCEDSIELEKLDKACKEWGFFQLINHGVDPLLVENVKIGTEQFFNLPMEKKKKFWQTEKEMQCFGQLINHGVDPLLVENVKIGTEQFFNLPMEEKKKFWQTTEDMEGFGQVYVALEEEKLRWGDMFFIKTLPIHRRHPHLIPLIPQPLRDNLENYYLELKKLCDKIIEYMSKALKINTNELLELFEEGRQAVKMSYYPPCPQPEKVIGLNPHSDGSAVTILLQVNDIQGLQIKLDGMWIPINPLSNAFVINVGDALEIMTNGIYGSIEHRVMVNSEKERISIATFHNPDTGGNVGPIPSLVTAERPALFKTITVENFVSGYLSSKIKGKSYLDVVRIQ